MNQAAAATTAMPRPNPTKVRRRDIANLVLPCPT
jgi:hypothetical protein